MNTLYDEARALVKSAIERGWVSMPAERRYDWRVPEKVPVRREPGEPKADYIRRYRREWSKRFRKKRAKVGVNNPQ